MALLACRFTLFTSFVCVQFFLSSRRQLIATTTTTITESDVSLCLKWCLFVRPTARRRVCVFRWWMGALWSCLCVSLHRLLCVCGCQPARGALPTPVFFEEAPRKLLLLHLLPPRLSCVYVCVLRMKDLCWYVLRWCRLQTEDRGGWGELVETQGADNQGGLNYA